MSGSFRFFPANRRPHHSAAQLYDAGWSAGELAHHAAGSVVWQVTAMRGEERIVVRAEAWSEAARRSSELIT